VSSKIKTLTPEQAAALVTYRAEWLTHGRSTAPANRAETARVFVAMYAALGKPAPYVWWCDGPAVGSLVRTILTQGRLGDNLGANLWANLGDNLWANLGANLGDNLRANLGDNLRANLRANLGDNLGANLRANLGDNLGANLWANLRDNLGANLWDNLGANLGDNLRANLWDNLGDNLGANLGDNLWANLDWSFWGQYEAPWPAYYAWPDGALRPMHTVEQREHLAWWVTLAQSCGWWQPFESVVFVCDRPLRQQIDADGRLHREDGPAFVCRDSWMFHAWHGVRVPADVIEQPETITPERIAAEANQEIRRAMIERIGWEVYLARAGAQPVQSDRYGDLYRLTLAETPLTLVVVTNSTPEMDGSRKRYGLLVPEDCQTAHAAVASTFGLTAETYQPVQET
jgi:hypothetical protein